MTTLDGRRTVLGGIVGLVALLFGVGTTAGNRTADLVEVEVDARNLQGIWAAQEAADRGREF